MAVEYEIKKNIGVISEKSSGWSKELNLVSWAGKEPKYDVREWDTNHEKMGKGVTFTREELYNLYKMLDKLLGDGESVRTNEGAMSTQDIINAGM